MAIIRLCAGAVIWDWKYTLELSSVGIILSPYELIAMFATRTRLDQRTKGPSGRRIVKRALGIILGMLQTIGSGTTDLNEITNCKHGTFFNNRSSRTSVFKKPMLHFRLLAYRSSRHESNSSERLQFEVNFMFDVFRAIISVCCG